MALRLQTDGFDPMLRGSSEETQMAVKRKTKPAKSAEPSLSAEALKRCYADMLLIRRFEERAGQMYGMGLIGGFCHLYIGQEAVVVGMQAALAEGDTVITSYRDHGHMLACGMDPKGVMSELTGRRCGYSHGKGGSMHMFSPEKNFFGGHGIVGAQVPIGTGLGFAHRYRDDGHISVTYLGDGAINQGQVYESFNMASLWKLRLGSHRPVSPRHRLWHPGRAGRRHGCGRGPRGRHDRGRACPLRPGADHSRNADLPLSRPFDVRSGEVSYQGRSQPDAQRARPDRPFAPAAARRSSGQGGRS
jgi:hypothetical protein